MSLYELIKTNEDISTYIIEADHYLEAIGYTEHGLAHVTKVAVMAKEILLDNHCDEHEVDLGMIACYLHDIGNSINRIDHAHSGAIMAFQLLEKLNFNASDIVQIVQAIGNHDEKSANCVSKISAALILADKCDVRRSRVRCNDEVDFDIHDRVNYSVTYSKLVLSEDKYTLNLVIDQEVSAIMDYFEIFLERMRLCQKACKYLNKDFGLVINNLILL